MARTKTHSPKKVQASFALDKIVSDALDAAIADLPGMSRSFWVNSILGAALLDRGYIKEISNSPGCTDYPGAAMPGDGVSVSAAAHVCQPARSESQTRRARVRL